jgi:hypothetical protein
VYKVWWNSETGVQKVGVVYNCEQGANGFTDIMATEYQE